VLLGTPARRSKCQSLAGSTMAQARNECLLVPHTPKPSPSGSPSNPCRSASRCRRFCWGEGRKAVRKAAYVSFLPWPDVGQSVKVWSKTVTPLWTTVILTLVNVMSVIVANGPAANGPRRRDGGRGPNSHCRHPRRRELQSSSAAKINRGTWQAQRRARQACPRPGNEAGASTPPKSPASSSLKSPPPPRKDGPIWVFSLRWLGKRATARAVQSAVSSSGSPETRAAALTVRSMIQVEQRRQPSARATADSGSSRSRLATPAVPQARGCDQLLEDRGAPGGAPLPRRVVVSRRPCAHSRTGRSSCSPARTSRHPRTAASCRPEVRGPRRCHGSPRRRRRSRRSDGKS
jgi:hypothetical protein